MGHSRSRNTKMKVKKGRVKRLLGNSVRRMRRVVVRSKQQDDVQNDKLTRAVAVKEELQKLIKAVRGKFQRIRRSEDEMRDSLEIGAKPFVAPLQRAVVEGLKTFAPVTVKKEEVIIPKTEKISKDVDKEGEESELEKTLDTSTQTERTVELPKKYLTRIGDSAYKEKLDFTYGVRPDGSGGLLIGDSKVTFTYWRQKAS